MPVLKMGSAAMDAMLILVTTGIVLGFSDGVKSVYIGNWAKTNAPMEGPLGGLALLGQPRFRYVSRDPFTDLMNSHVPRYVNKVRLRFVKGKKPRKIEWPSLAGRQLLRRKHRTSWKQRNRRQSAPKPTLLDKCKMMDRQPLSLLHEKTEEQKALESFCKLQKSLPFLTGPRFFGK